MSDADKLLKDMTRKLCLKMENEHDCIFFNQSDFNYIFQALQQVRRETVDEVCTFLLTPCVGSCPADALPSREAVAELIEKKFGGRP